MFIYVMCNVFFFFPSPQPDSECSDSQESCEELELRRKKIEALKVREYRIYIFDKLLVSGCVCFSTGTVLEFGCNILLCVFIRGRLSQRPVQLS